MTRVALCGAGMIAHAHAAAARLNGFPLTAVASRHRERARRVAGDWSAAAVGYADLPAGADLVVVATPPQRHADDAIRLLDAGCLVLLEKPLCTTLADADRVVDAAARHGQRLLYAENLAYSPCITTLLSQVGGLGPLGHLEARTLQPLPHWGGFTTQEWGGGALFDLGVLYQEKLDLPEQALASFERFLAQDAPAQDVRTVADLDDCAYPASAPNLPIEVLYRAAAESDPGVQTLDLDRFFCPDGETCPAAIDGVVVRRDWLHPTASFVDLHRDVLRDAINAAGDAPG